MKPPLVAEHQWITELKDIPLWQPPYKRHVVISPHPDDETLGAGGLIASQRRLGAPVQVIAVTDGDAAYPDFEGLAAIRCVEQTMAVELLGAGKNSVVRLHLPDSKVADHETNLENLLASLITADDLVVAPWDLDSHPDHEACGRAAQKVAQRTGAELIFYLFWTWHHKEPVALAGKNLLRFALDTQLQAAKWAALQCHRTQLQYEKGEPILPEKLLGPAKRPFEIFIMG